MTRSALTLAVLIAVALASPAHAEELRLSEAAGARFPDRSYALTLPLEARLTAADVHVTENGRPVRGLTLSQPSGAEARGFGVVLAIDTSGSMRGRPLAAALRSARAFVQHRRPSQPIAVVTFAGDVRVVQEFTTDPAAIDQALQDVRVAPGGSRILDGAARSVELIRAAKMPSGSVVILSDGADHHSEIPADEVTASAIAANARVYTIGLRSRSTDFGALNLLAAGSHAEFSAATSLTDLGRIFERLGSRLAHQYLLRYRSAAPAGVRVHVAVRIAGLPGVAEAGYKTPAVSRAHRPPFTHGVGETLWLSPAAALAIALVAGALVVLGLWALLRPRTATLRQRVASFVGQADSTEDADRRAKMLSDRMKLGVGRSLEKARWWPAFIEKLDVGRVHVAPQRLVAWVAVATLTMIALLTLVSGKPVIAIIALIVPLGARAALKRRVAGQRKLFVDQLPDNLQIMASAMRAGHSFSGALSVVVADAPEPTRTEMARVVADERMGIPIDTALAGVVRRMDSKDLEQVALVATLQRETGGNTAELLERVTENIRERLALRRMVQSLTAQGRMSRWVLTAIPVVLLGLITVLNPVYVQPLYTNPLGQLILGVAAFMVVCGSLAIGKIVDIKV